jgi:hypothetical protein
LTYPRRVCPQTSGRRRQAVNETRRCSPRWPGVVSAKLTVLEEAFTAYFTDHHAFLLAKMLARVDAISADVAELDEKIEAEIAPFARAVDRLDEIPGVGPTAAHVLVSEIGLDMARFPTPAHLPTWARFAPNGGRVGRQEEGQEPHRPRQPVTGLLGAVHRDPSEDPLGGVARHLPHRQGIQARLRFCLRTPCDRARLGRCLTALYGNLRCRELQGLARSVGLPARLEERARGTLWQRAAHFGDHIQRARLESVQ